MKRLTFGNPRTSHWQLVIEGASRHEQVVVISGELHAELFIAKTPLCINPLQLEAFASGVEALDNTLNGTATLLSVNEQSEVEWTLTALSLGHIESSGRFKINENELLFRFRTDQTQLKPLREWLRSALFVYANHT
jgi:hypothetical protein